MDFQREDIVAELDRVYTTAKWEDSDTPKLLLSVDVKSQSAEKKGEALRDTMGEEMSAVIKRLRDESGVDPLDVGELIKKGSESTALKDIFPVFMKTEILVECNVKGEGD